MKNLIRTYKSIENNDGSYTEDVTGHCVTIEYDNDGILERVINNHVVLGLGKKAYAMNLVYERKNNSNEWVNVGSKLVKTSPDIYVDSNGDKVLEPFEMVDGPNEKYDENGQSYDPKQYFQVKQLKSGLIPEREILSDIIGNAALYPYFTQVLLKNNQIQTV